MSTRAISTLGLAVAGGFLLLAITVAAAGSALGALAFLLLAGGVGTIAILDTRPAPALPSPTDPALTALGAQLAEEVRRRTLAEQRLAALEAAGAIERAPDVARPQYVAAGDRFAYLEIPR